MSNVLWGTGIPVFIASLNPNGGNYVLIELPYPTECKEIFPPDDIPHKKLTGKRDEKTRGFYLHCELYYDMFDRATAIKIKTLINYSKVGKITFKPHKDFSLSYLVKVNEEEGFNFVWVANKTTHGYEGTLVIRGTEWIANTPIEKPETTPDPDGPGAMEDIPAGAVV